VNRIWLDGKLRHDGAHVSIHDRGFTLGDGLFETILVQNHVALWRDAHVERMRRGASLLGISFPAQDVNTAMDALLATGTGHHVLRLTLTRGAGSRGLAGDAERSTLVGTLADFDPGLQFQPITLCISSIERNLRSPTASIKTTSYIDQVMATREAAQRECDDALMLNSEGRVACCASGNIFLTMAKRLVTPSLGEGILNGIMRTLVIQAAQQAGLEVTEQPVQRSDLAVADGMFATNSLRFMRPVVLLEGRTLARPALVLGKITPYLLEMHKQQISASRQE
jgi:branched-chain amino acid aminotransferase